MNAIAGNHKDAAMALKKAGANPSNATNYGRNALHVASMKGRWWWVVVGGGEWWLVNSVSRYKVTDFLSFLCFFFCFFCFVFSCSSSSVFSSTHTRIGGHGTFVVGLGQINDEGQRQSGLDPDVLRR
jgi:hypothetical protein